DSVRRGGLSDADYRRLSGGPPTLAGVCDAPNRFRERPNRGGIQERAAEIENKRPSPIPPTGKTEGGSFQHYVLRSACIDFQVADTACRCGTQHQTHSRSPGLSAISALQHVGPRCCVAIEGITQSKVNCVRRTPKRRSSARSCYKAIGKCNPIRLVLLEIRGLPQSAR